MDVLKLTVFGIISLVIISCIYMIKFFKSCTRMTCAPKQETKQDKTQKSIRQWMIKQQCNRQADDLHESITRFRRGE